MRIKPLLILPLLALAPAITRADVLDIKTVPADAKWLLHLDADALVKTQTWKVVEPHLQKNPEYTKNIANLERIFAAKFPTDLHDITLFGPGFDPKSAVVIVHASVDQERLKTLLSVNETYSTQTLSGYTIHGWVDKGKQLYGGFADGNRLVVGQSPEGIAATLDTLAGKTDSLKSDQLLGGTKDAAIAYVAGSELAKLAEMRASKNPMTAKLQSAWLAASEDAAGVHLNGHVVADDAAMAQNIVKYIDGMKAYISFAQPDDDGDMTLFANALNGLSAKALDKAVDIVWTIPVPTLGQIIDRNSPATQP